MINQTTPLISGVQLTNDEMLIKDETGRLTYQASKAVVELTKTTLTVSFIKKDAPAKKAIQFDTSALVGFEYKPVRGSSAEFVFKAKFILYPVKKEWLCHSNKAGDVRSRKELVIFFHTEETTCMNWKHAVYSIVYDQFPLEYDKNCTTFIPPRSKEFVVFVNPKSGSGTALKIWKKCVKPMLEEAKIIVELIVTEYANHAREFVHNHPNITKYAAIMMIGGDGIIYEVFNGLASREDGMSILKQVTLAPIPGGTGNGLVKSILYECHEHGSPLNATFASIRGKPVPLDISRVVTNDKQVHYSFLALFWGIIADVDIHSEVLRCLGEPRLYLGGVYFVMRRLVYRGRLRMKLIPECTYADKKLVSKIKFNQLKPNERVDNDSWVTIESDFTMVTVVQVSHIAMSVHAGPGIRLADGAFTVCVMENAGRLSLAHLLLSMDGGDHIYNSQLRLFQCSEYSLEPLTERGIYSLDGEIVPYGKIEATMLPSATNVFAIPK
jgi:sphingosine kinase